MANNPSEFRLLPPLSRFRSLTQRACAVSPDDFEAILSRARTAGVGIQLLTGDCIEGSKEVLSLAAQYGQLFFFLSRSRLTGTDVGVRVA